MKKKQLSSKDRQQKIKQCEAVISNAINIKEEALRGNYGSLKDGVIIACDASIECMNASIDFWKTFVTHADLSTKPRSRQTENRIGQSIADLEELAFDIKTPNKIASAALSQLIKLRPIKVELP